MKTVQQIITDIDWAQVFRIIEHMGNTLNDRMDRSDKGKLIEKAISAFRMVNLCELIE